MPLTDNILNPDLLRPQPRLASAVDPSQDAFFSVLLPAFERHGVRYCAIQAQDGFLTGTDFAVHPGDREKIAGVLADVREAGFLPVQVLEFENGESRIIFARVAGLEIKTFAADLLTASRDGISAKQIVEGRRKERTLWVAAKADDGTSRQMPSGSRLRARQGNGACLVFLGPDGVGKTTMLRALSKSLQAVFPEQSIYRWRPAVFARAPRLARLPHSKPPRSFSGSIAYLFFTWVDFVSGYLAAIRQTLSRNGLVIFDRDFHDLLIDPRRYRFCGPLWMVRAFGRIVPPRDVFFVVLDAQEQTILSRKQQLPEEEIRRQRQAYRKFSEQAPAAVLVSTEHDLATCRAQALQQIFEYLAHRLARRHPKWFVRSATTQLSQPARTTVSESPKQSATPAA
jgi:thymidylate kinase